MEPTILDIEVEHCILNTIPKYFQGLKRLLSVTLYLSCHLHSHIVKKYHECHESGSPELTKVPNLRITVNYANNAQNTQKCPQVPILSQSAQTAQMG